MGSQRIGHDLATEQQYDISQVPYELSLIIRAGTLSRSSNLLFLEVTPVMGEREYTASADM